MLFAFSHRNRSWAVSKNKRFRETVWIIGAVRPCEIESIGDGSGNGDGGGSGTTDNGDGRASADWNVRKYSRNHANFDGSWRANNWQVELRVSSLGLFPGLWILYRPEPHTSWISNRVGFHVFDLWMFRTPRKAVSSRSTWNNYEKSPLEWCYNTVR